MYVSCLLLAVTLECKIYGEPRYLNVLSTEQPFDEFQEYHRLGERNGLILFGFCVLCGSSARESNPGPCTC